MSPQSGDADGPDSDGEDTDVPWVDDEIVPSLESAKEQPSPLTLDIDGLGGVELTDINSTGAVYFDLDIDGFAEATSWVTGGDGLLALDVNDDGIINNGSELFGDQTGYANGFLALKALDSNADNAITAADADYSNLLVWIDTSMDGYSQSGELYTLSNLLITSINLAYSDVSYTISSNDIRQDSTFTINGNSQTIVDAYFDVSEVNTVYNQDFILDAQTFFLPTLRGYGAIPSLHIAMSFDSTGTGNLLELVEDFYAKTLTDIFDPAAGTIDDVRALMHRWAGADGISPTSRGANVDARDLVSLEKLTGEDFLQLGYVSDPRYQAGKGVTDTFDIALNAILARLALQGSAKELFVNDLVYDIATDSFGTLGELGTTVLANLSTAAALLPDASPFWENVLRVVIGVKGEANLTTTDTTALNTAIYNSDSSLTFTIVRDTLFADTSEGVAVYGDSGDNTLNGTVKDDMIEADTGNDTLNGGQGGDTMYGEAGNDILVGDAGDDLLLGGIGDDSFQYNLGDGVDTIRETTQSEVNDEIVFGAGIAITDLTFNRLSNNDLSIVIDATGGQGEIVIEDQFDPSNSDGSVETLVFADTTTFDLTSLNFTLTGTALSETLYGITVAGTEDDTIYGEGGNDRIYGYFGADELHGGSGDDIIYGGSSSSVYYTETTSNILYGDAGNDHIEASYGIDHIHGGTGNDAMFGSRGDDEYYFNLNDGNDVITEVDASGYGVTDTLNLGAGIDVADVSIIRSGSYNLKILINGGQEGSITITDQFKTSSSAGAIEYIQFNDTTVLDLTTMGFGLVATDSAETLHGNNSGSGSPDDIIYAEGGNDLVYGYLGADELHGGDGNDVVYAGTSSSSYYGKTTTNYLYGDAGDDALYGSHGVDHFYGGTDDDELTGWLGNDHFYFFRGDGEDTIQEYEPVSGSDNIDTLHLGETIDASDLSYARDGNYDLKILINGGAGGTINVIDQFYTGASDGSVEYIQLSDSSQIDLGAMNYVLTGTVAGEALYGTQINSLSDDTIYGEGGNDTISSYLGADELHGGDGNDVIYAGSSSSTYYSKTTTNYLYGDADNDTIYGANGIDHLYGGTGDDAMFGRLGNDHFYFNLNGGIDSITETEGVSGTDNIDTLHLGPGIDAGDLSYARDGNYDLQILINGGAGGTINLIKQFYTGASDGAVEYIQLSDTTQIDLRTMNYVLAGTSAGEALYGTQINSLTDDTIYGEGGNDTISGYLGADELHGGDGSDIIHAGTSSGTYYDKTTTNYLYGDADNDTIYGSYGVDYIYGGTGDDALTGRRGNDHFYFNLNDGIDSITEQDVVSGTDNIDTLHLGAGIDAGDLSYARDGNYNLKVLINGGTGGTINLLAQFDTDASDGAVEYIQLSDTTQIDLRTMNYILTGTSAGESLYGTQTNSLTDDTIYGEGGNDTILGYLGADELHGGDGNDIIHAGTSSSGYYNKTTVNYLYGDAGKDTIYGANGADHIEGGTGDDIINGRAGNDLFLYASGLDSVTDTAGTDTLYIEGATTVNDITFSNVSTYNTKITVTASVDEITVVNLRHGTAANHVDFIEFADGFKTSLPDYASWTNGTSGVDSLTGTSGDNTIIGLAGADTLDGADGADDIHGGAGNDTLEGGAGTDLLHGGVEDDLLYGQDGLDTLFGGAGADTFVFETATAFNNVDVIKDFSTAQNDVLDLSDLLSAYDPMTDAITDFVWITENGGNSNLFVDQDGLGTTHSLVAIANLTSTTGLTDEAALLANGHLLAA